ncbi:MAG: ATP-binding protein [Bacteroidales bacterium]|nr:ATP-binding protein [Bacteroidales bacterium]
MIFEYQIEGGDFTKAGSASSEVKKILRQLNLEPSLIKRIAVAMYEAEVNVVAHAYRGTMTVDIDTGRIFIAVKDEGPGIEDIEKAMTEGWSTANEKVREMGFGAGMGLPNIKKNADELKITSTPGTGTKVEITCFTRL